METFTVLGQKINIDNFPVKIEEGERFYPFRAMFFLEHYIRESNKQLKEVDYLDVEKKYAGITI